MKNATFFGHPKQLGTLFHLEVWERFSFYGMQAILMIYLYYTLGDGGLGLDKALAGGVVGAYGGSVYLFTVAGAWLADRALGAERVLFYSAAVVMLGHISLALVGGLGGLILGLCFVALGSGGIKASIYTLLGSLYDDKKTLQDAGFSVFYIAINIGALFGPLAVGYLQNAKGFHYAFAAAAVGMAFGLILYAKNRGDLQAINPPAPLTAQAKTRAIVASGAFLGALAFLVATRALTLANFKTALLGAVVALTIGYFSRLLRDKRLSAQSKQHIIAYIPLFVGVCVFWALFFQNYTLFTVFFDAHVDRTVGGFTVPVGWQQSIQGLCVIVLAGLTATLWAKLGQKAPKTPLKFALALFIAAAAFALYTPYLRSGAAMPLGFYALTLATITVAELFLVPISLSFIGKIAPDFCKTQAIALNFLAISMGMTLGGFLFGAHFDESNPERFYWAMAALGAGSGFLLLLLTPILNKMLKDVD